MFGFLGGKKSKDDKDKSTAPKTKKAKGYFLELDETGNVKSAYIAEKPEPVKAAVSAAEPPKAEPVVEAKKPEPAKADEAKKPEPAKAKATPKQVKIEAQPNPPAPPAVASNGKAEPQSELTFAPNYLLPIASTSRRRPGPSMDSFRDMARQVKPRS
jgi:hypothetical protein